MSFLREFHYSNISQRKLIDYNNFLSFILIGVLFADISLVLKYYFFYYPVIKLIVIFGFGGIFIGNQIGRLLYSKYRNFRFIYIFAETAFLVLFLIYIFRNLIIPGATEFFIVLFFRFPYSIPALIFIAALFFGIKIKYSIRVSCGNFIDKTQGVERFIGFMFLGIPLGMVLSGLLYSLGIPLVVVAPLPLLILPSIVLMNLPYNPEPLYTKDDEEEKDRELKSTQVRSNENALFTYLTFLYIIVYAYLSYLSVSRYYGDLIYVKLVFIALLFVIMLLGYIAGRFITVSSVHVYGEAFLPIAFLAFLILLLNFNMSLNFVVGILLFAPVAVLLGIMLYHNVRTMVIQYDNKKRAAIIEFALFILPAPIIISLSLIAFTNLWFYIVILVLMIMNVAIPALFMINSKVVGYRKAVYFFFSIFFLPLLIFIIIFFRISLDSTMYVTKIRNFEELRNVNYNADYIKSRATVTMNRVPVFAISDSIVRNHKRSLVPIALYHPENKKILFIDGNQKFFRNPVIGYFKNSICLDVLTEQDVDYNRLPYSGTQKYVPDNDRLLLYFEKHPARYYTIVDIPNLFDQTMNPFRFSAEYYMLLKERMEKGGLFIQVFNIPDCRPELFSSAVANLRRSFARQIVFFFSNIMVVFSSDNEKAFAFNQNAYSMLVSFISNHEDVMKLYENEVHVLSHLLYTRIDDLIPVIQGGKYIPGISLLPSDQFRLTKRFFDDYTANNKKMYDLIDRSPDQYAFVQVVSTAFQSDDQILTLLKKAELAEARENYQEETQLMFELKKQAEFRINLQDYVRNMLQYKEKFFYNAALRLENNRKWEEAKQLYLAVLAINPDNFDANYRIGLLYITLQDIDSSFRYLQEAMRINRDHPKALFQMGVLYFSSGRIAEAIMYFNRALEQNEKSPSIFRYLGLCYEKLKNLSEAERYYTKAIIADPNDVDTKSRLDEVRSQIKKENKKWETPEQRNESDVEQDADMPLPVSKGAYDIRLKDNDTTLPVIDPVTGNEIPPDSKQESMGAGK